MMADIGQVGMLPISPGFGKPTHTKVRPYIYNI